MQGFEKLRIYQNALQGIKMIYLLTTDPKLIKDYSLIDQIRRAACSVCANIAEGYGRQTRKDRSQFLTYAIGSANEVIAFLDIINAVKDISTDKEKNYFNLLGKQIYVFRSKLPNS